MRQPIREILRGRLVSNPDPRGLRLRGTRIVGRLDLKILRAALQANGVQVGLALHFVNGRAVGSGAYGAVRLVRARVGSRLDCSGTVVRNVSGPALTAESMSAGEDVLLGGGFEATGAGQGGTRPRPAFGCPLRVAWVSHDVSHVVNAVAMDCCFGVAGCCLGGGGRLDH